MTDMAVMDDLADGEDKGLSRVDLVEYFEDSRENQQWRAVADRCCDYYDGNQLDAETLQEMRRRGIGPLINNLIKPSIDVVLGMEAKTRSDWRVVADDDLYQEVAEGLSAKLAEAERESRADHAMSEAYAQMVKAGVGWCEVSRRSDPFRYRYRVAPVHRREMYWDMRAQEYDLSDARYIIRRRWFGKDELKSAMPDRKELIDGAISGAGDELLVDMASARYSFDPDVVRGPTIEEMEWRDVYRQRACVYEVIYRRHVRGRILRFRSGRVVEYSGSQAQHAAIATGMVTPEIAVYQRSRTAWFLGPYKLYEGGETGASAKYIPFFCYREDLTGSPYGLIRAALSPQDEVNARRQKLMWLLSARRLITDSDAIDTRYNDLQRVADELARPDSAVVLNPERRNAGGFQILDNIGLAAQQFEILQEAKKSIQECMGVYQAMLGMSSSASSGLAINSLVEQGSTTLAELNDNDRHSCRLTGEALLSMIRVDIGKSPVKILTGEGPKRKTILLNQRAIDRQTGVAVVENDVQRAGVKIALTDVPSTPAFRGQQLQMITQTLSALPPQMQALLAPFYIEATDLTNRHEMADILRKATGQQGGDGQEDPEKAALIAKVQELTQALQQISQAPETNERNARAQKALAEAEATRLDTALKMDEARSTATMMVP